MYVAKTRRACFPFPSSRRDGWLVADFRFRHFHPSRSRMRDAGFRGAGGRGSGVGAVGGGWWVHGGRCVSYREKHHAQHRGFYIYPGEGEGEGEGG